MNEDEFQPCEECGARLTCEHKGEWLFGWEG
jgi:hypothetical protein